VALRRRGAKENAFLSGLILRMRGLSDRKVALHLSEFTVDPSVRNFV
jgi:hypothetical protein